MSRMLSVVIRGDASALMYEFARMMRRFSLTLWARHARQLEHFSMLDGEADE